MLTSLSMERTSFAPVPMSRCNISKLWTPYQISESPAGAVPIAPKQLPMTTGCPFVFSIAALIAGENGRLEPDHTRVP